MTSKGHCFMDSDNMEYDQFFLEPGLSPDEDDRSFEILDSSFHDDQSDFCFRALQQSLKQSQGK